MTVTVSRLREWSIEDLPGAARDLAATENLLIELHEGVSRAMSGMTWQSPGADAARAAAEDLSAALRTLSGSFQMHAVVVLRAAGAFEAARALLDRAQGLAAEHGLWLGEDGRVREPPAVMYSADAPTEQVTAILDRRQAAVDASVRATVLAQQALASASEADGDAAAALRAGDRIGALLAGIAPGAGGLFGLLRPPVAWGEALRDRLLDAVDGRAGPEKGSDPAEVSAWWASLPAAQQAALAAKDFASLGHLDGLPASVRDAANRRRLPVERAALQAEVHRLRRELDGNWFGGMFTYDNERLAEALDKLEALDRIEAVLAPPATERFLLVLDNSGERLCAAVADGDVDRADHVSVFTPGLTTTVQGSLQSYDKQLAELRQQADDLLLQTGAGSAATVAWLGYEAPQWSDMWRPSRTVLGEQAAERGAVRLEAFLNGLDGARDIPAHLTALGHSYGSLTTSLALQRGTGVDDAVFFGSPGLGTSQIKDLGLQPGRVYVIEARGDVVADLAVFGIDPNQLNGVTSLSAARTIIENIERAESQGHSEYLTDYTTSQYGLAAVIAGLPHLAPRAHDDGFGDFLQTPIPGSN